MHTLADEKININGRNIHYKVLSSSNAPHQQPFLLCVQGGPGFSSLSMELALADLEKQAKAANLPMPNLIFIDPVGCGQSDKAEDVEAEYSLRNYSEIHARVVEHVKTQFSPNDVMDLRIYGGSFGGMAVMDLPVHRPQWLEDNSDIRLRQIIANVAPNGAGDKEYSLKFVEDNFKTHPDYAEIMVYLNKLLDGEIKDQDEYLRFVFALAPLYSDELAKTKNSFFGRLLMNHPQGTMGALKLLNKVLGSGSLSFMIEGLTGCSIDVLNQFFKGDHNNVDLTQQVKENAELYAKVPICMIACNRDHMVNAETSFGISKLLPDTCAAVILNDKHQSRSGPTKEVFIEVLLGLICRSNIPMQKLESTAVAKHTVTEQFNVMLETLKKPLPKYDSTARTLAALSRAGDVIGMNDNCYIDDQVAAAAPAVVEKGKAESEECSVIRVETPVVKMGGLG